jgi:uncharacterized membrane protein YgdD (TMEM256/DUF423 family)
MKRSFLAWGFFFGLTAVILGAFAAHALEKVLERDAIESFQTGVRYQMLHALLLILLGSLDELRTKALFYLIVIGVIFFSFSIYLLNLREVIGMESLKWLGPITPIGGSLLIIAWGILLFKSLRSNISK